jgi:Raf kinase inhibitor-like YbhB/YbcL family protein
MRMTKAAVFGLLAAVVLVATPAYAKTLKVSVDSFKNGGTIPNKHALCVPAAQGHVAPGPDISPRISWSKGPAGTKSYVVTLTDTDSPAAEREKMNKEGMTLTSSVPRKTFFHWVLVDIPARVTSLPEGAESTARVVHGKPSTTKIGVRGLNEFTIIFAANDALKGQYYGYDGPCPPWNDENIHHMHFTVYALSVPTLNLTGAFGGPEAMAALKDKVLAHGEVIGLYTQNPAKGAQIPK